MVLRVRWRAGCLVTSSIPLKRGHDEYQITTRSLAVLKNLVNSFRKGTRWTRQITGSVDLSEMDCIARRHARDFRQVLPCKNGDWPRDLWAISGNACINSICRPSGLLSRSPECLTTPFRGDHSLGQS